MTRIKMIGLDLDGTLLTDKKEITERTKRALRAAIDSGIVVLAATGRPLTGIPEEVRNFPGMRYALTSNGAKVVDIWEDRVVDEHLLSSELAQKALEICGKYDTLQEVYYDGVSYAPADKRDQIPKYHKNPNMWEYMRRTRTWKDDIPGMVRERSCGLDKIQILFAEMEERTEAWRELSEIKGLELVGSLGYNIEINAAGVNKGTGLVSLGRLLGIERGEIMACGDGDNDLLMIKEVGFGVAMANAEEEVRKAADYITLSNEEDGVADAIEKFALRGGEGVC